MQKSIPSSSRLNLQRHCACHAWQEGKGSHLKNTLVEPNVNSSWMARDGIAYLKPTTRASLTRRGSALELHRDTAHLPFKKLACLHALRNMSRRTFSFRQLKHALLPLVFLAFTKALLAEPLPLAMVPAASRQSILTAISSSSSSSLASNSCVSREERFDTDSELLAKRLFVFCFREEGRGASAEGEGLKAVAGWIKVWFGSCRKKLADDVLSTEESRRGGSG